MKPKYIGNIPKTLRDWADRHPHIVQEIDCGNGYSTDRGDGFAYDVLLRAGWSMSDDCVHTLIEPTVKDMLRQLRAAAPCDCDECKDRKANV